MAEVIVICPFRQTSGVEPCNSGQVKALRREIEELLKEIKAEKEGDVPLFPKRKEKN